MSGDKQRIGQIIGIGAKMRSAREAKKASLADISAQLHIRENHLLALEQETFEDLPGDVYAIGFIRTYAGYLGLNAAEMVSRFKSVQQPDSVNEVTASESEKKPISTALKIGLAVVCVIVFFIMWLIAAPDMPNQIKSEIGAVNNAPDNKNDKLPDVAKNKPKAAPINEGAKVLKAPPPTISPVP
ncbi:MAG: helix-turn-helix domain-containing protein, partial [Parvibaculales bacterium]